MPDVTVDPALFRLRAFEAEWLRPISNTLATEPAEAGSWLANPEAALNAVLAIEAERWVLDGHQMGYFAQPPDSIMREVERIVGTAGFLGVDLFFRQHVTGERPDNLVRVARALEDKPADLLTFARALAEAREDLTAERRSFLRLMFFEPEAEFKKRLAEVHRVADALKRRPWLSLPDGAVDRIAWSLQGAESQVSSNEALPSWWRTDSSHVSWHHEGPWADELYYSAEVRRSAWQRWQDLVVARTTIFAATEWNIEYESAPVEVRSALARELQREGEIPEDSPRAWALWDDLEDDAPED